MAPAIVSLTAERKPHGLVISGDHGSLEIGKCYEYTVEVKDSAGEVFSGEKLSVHLSTPAGSGRYFASQSLCESDLYTTKNIKTENYDVTGSAPIYFRPTSRNSVRLRADALSEDNYQVEVDSDKVQMVHRAVAHLKLINSPSSGIKGGRCSDKFTVQIQDGVGDTYNNDGITLNLSGERSGAFYDHQNCNQGSAISGNSIVVNSLTTSADFYYKNNQHQSVTLNVAVGGSSDINVDSNEYSIGKVVDHFVVRVRDGNKDDVLLNECSEEYEVEARDSTGVSYTGGTTVYFDLSSGDGYFYGSQSECDGESNPINDSNLLTIIPGQSTHEFFFRAKSSDSVATFEAKNSEAGAANSLTLTVLRHARKVKFVDRSPSVGGGECEPIEIQMFDNMDVAYNNSGIRVDLTQTGDGVFYSSCGGTPINDVTFPTNSGGSTVSFFYKNLTVDQHVFITVTPRVPIQSPPHPTMSGDTIDFTIASAPYKLDITGGPNSVNLGVCNSYTVEVKNSSNGSYAGNVDIRLDTTSGVGRFFGSKASCDDEFDNNPSNGTSRPINLFTITNGSEVFWVRAVGKDIKDEIELRASKTGVISVPGGKTVSVTHTAAKIVLSGPGTVTATVCSSGAYSVTIQDGMGADNTDHGALTVDLNNHDNVQYFSDSVCETPLSPPLRITIPANLADSNGFYILGSQQESINLAATETGSLFTARQTVSINRDALGLDPTFGDGGSGTKKVRLVGSVSEDSAKAVIIIDGNFIVAGKSTGNNDSIGLMNIDMDGNLTGFSKKTESIGSNSFADAMIVDDSDSGYFLVAGGSDEDFLLARFYKDGSLDDSGFGATPSSGFTATDFSGANPTIDEAAAIALLPNGDIVVAGTVEEDIVGGHKDFAIAIYDGSDGDEIRSVIVPIGSGTRNNQLTAMAIQDGKIVLVGYNNSDFLVARVDTLGNLDTDFSGNGWVTWNFFGFDKATSVAIDSSNNVVVAGHTSYSDQDIVVARLTDAGVKNGSSRFDYGDENYAHTIAIESDGNYIVAGSVAGNGLVARITPAWSSLNNNEILLGHSNDAFLDCLIDADGKSVLVGQGGTGGSGDTLFTITRLLY